MIVATDKSESGIIDALAYLLDYAEKEKKPMAINLSMGTVIGFKDGTDPIASMIDELLDKRFDGALPAFVAAFTKSSHVSDKELDEVQKMIDLYRKENHHG